MNLKISIIAILSSIILLSCITTKPVSNNTESNQSATENVIAKVAKSSENYHTISAKMSINLKSDKNLNLKGNIKATRDSIIWISLSPALGLEVARIVMLPDSIYVLDRLRKNCYYGSYSVVEQMFHVDMSFKTIQAILFNNLYVQNQESFPNMSVETQDENFTKLTSTIKTTDSIETKLYQEIIINKDWNVNSIFVEDKTNNRNLKIDYSNFTNFENVNKPTNLSLAYKESDKFVNMNLDYSKIELNLDNKYQFSIPDSYGKIKY